MKRYPEELRKKVVAALDELDSSKPANASAISIINRGSGDSSDVSLSVLISDKRQTQQPESVDRQFQGIYLTIHRSSLGLDTRSSLLYLKRYQPS